jgi:putative redox protein
MSDAHPHTLGRAHARIGETNYAVDIRAGGRHPLRSDEPAAVGGADAGPGPFSLVMSGLCACTAITLRMYAQRKGWLLQAVEVDASITRTGDANHVERSIGLHGELDEAQKARLLEISEKTPVTLALKGGMAIHTRLREVGAAS